MKPNALKKQLHHRLESYWRMELSCAVLLPATMLLPFVYLSQAIGPSSILALITMSSLLVVGGSYWRAKSLQIAGDECALEATLSWVICARIPLLIAVVVSLVVCTLDLFFFRISFSTVDRMTAAIATTMAVLEYINYFHRQLQHFDHMPDFHRLTTGRGFRRSKLCNDLRRFRLSQK